MHMLETKRTNDWNRNAAAADDDYNDNYNDDDNDDDDDDVFSILHFFLYMYSPSQSVISIMNSGSFLYNHSFISN